MAAKGAVDVVAREPQKKTNRKLEKGERRERSVPRGKELHEGVLATVRDERLVVLLGEFGGAAETAGHAEREHSKAKHL